MIDFHHLIAGTAGGLAATVALYPLELIKTRMQVIDTKDHVYRHFTATCRTVLREEGIGGFYQGMSPAIFAASGSWGGYFYLYEKSKQRKLNDRNCDALSPADHMLSGIEAGSILVFVFNPFWVVKTRLALQGAESNVPLERRYTGMTHALRTIWRDEGLNGLYKGVIPALFLTTHGAIQFTIYEKMKTMASSFRKLEDKNDQPAWVSVFLGGTSKIVAATVTYPYQVIKSRLQQRDIGESSSLPRYSGTIDCALKIWRRDGLQGFFRGVVPNALKVAPSAAVTFLMYEECMKLLKS